MSATNRGSVRHEADFYATPLESVYSFLDNYDGITESDKILEPSAGNGNIIRALRDKGYFNLITAVELRDTESKNLRAAGANIVLVDDFLTMDRLSTYDVIIGNPPYSLAQEFIDRSIDLLKPGGKLIFLLRTNFLESKKRFEWWQRKRLAGLYVLSKRPSFTGKGTDATSYSWFVWVKGEEDQTIKVI